ncbi:MAG: hypothetical protein M3Q07_12530, partial [Pseudobdellovibrionaceae bacterium]|nr:hypothetical protein [Pseudobdellovibrionaceae bacterium]
MNQRIFSQSTIAACRECVFIEEDMHGFLLEDALCRAGISREALQDPHRARIAFDGLLQAVDWTNPKSISVIVPIFAAAYEESPKSDRSIHYKIDEALARDGFMLDHCNLLRVEG